MIKPDVFDLSNKLNGIIRGVFQHGFSVGYVVVSETDTVDVRDFLIGLYDERGTTLSRPYKPTDIQIYIRPDGVNCSSVFTQSGSGAFGGRCGFAVVGERRGDQEQRDAQDLKKRAYKNE